MSDTTHDIVIIGSGPSGLTAGIYAARADLDTVLYAGDKWGGQLMLTTEVENFPGFPEGIMGPQLMANMRQQAERFGVDFRLKWAKSVSKNDHGTFTVTDSDGQTLTAKAVIMAMGADTRWLGVPGEEQLRGRGVSSCATCDAAFFRDKRVFIVGGGDSAMEEALFIAKFASEVFVVHRRSEFRASKIMAQRVLDHDKIKVIWDTDVISLNGEQMLQSVTLRTTKQRFDTDGEAYLQWTASPSSRKDGTPADSAARHPDPSAELEDEATTSEGSSSDNQDTVTWTAQIDGLFVAIGHSPNTKEFQETVELDEKGYLKSISDQENAITNFTCSHPKACNQTEIALQYPTMSSVEGIFVSGDVHDHKYRQAITAAAFGTMAALDAERWLESREE